MTYMAVSAQKPEDLLDMAERRWSALSATRPDLEPAVVLQRRLLGLVITRAAALESGDPPRLSLPPKYLAAKLARGIPVFSGEPIPLPVPALRSTLLELCDAFAECGAQEASAHIREAVDTGNLDAGSLLSASLTRDHAAIRSGATERGLAPDLVWLIAELAVSPFVHLLEQQFLATDTLAEALGAWPHGYCPACGSWPAVAEVVAGHRALRCSFCSGAWEPAEYVCIYCGEGGETFVTAAPDVSRTDRRVEACGACGAYLKTIDLVDLSPFPLIAISDIETIELDTAAMDHGYVRPPLKDVKT
jgi:FdhE protein